jgi:hypothetical protein
MLILIVYLLFCVMDGIDFHANFILLVFPVLCLLVMNIGVGMVLSALYVFFRDMTYLYIRDIFGYNRDLGCEHLGRDYAADVVKPDMTDFYEQELQFYHDNPGIFIAKDFGAVG